MLHVTRNESPNPKPDSDPNCFTREEAKRTLDEVRRRYGIHESAPQAHPRVYPSLIVTTEPAKHTQPPLRPESSGSEARVSPAGQRPSRPPLKPARARHPIIPASTSDNKCFPFLIRIAECTLTLLCEVTADSEAAAMHHLQQIPNLLEWREISIEECVSLVRTFRLP
jgi:hypothetical protein